MKNCSYKRYSFFVVLGLILSYITINSCAQPPKEQPLIKHVSISAIIADTRIFGDKVGDANSIPPAPWHARFKIALNGKILDELQPNRDARFDTTLFDFDGTLIDFRGSELPEELAGIHFRTLSHDTLQADFDIPRIIPNWNFEENPVVMVVKVTKVTDSDMTQKAGLFLLSSALLRPAESAEGERRINGAMYEGENSFEGKYDEETGRSTNGLTGGTGLDDE